MNKGKIDELIPKAYDTLREVGIADKNGQVDQGYSGQIAAFGAAVATGSLLSAVSFFSAQGGSKVDRSLLMDAIYALLPSEKQNASPGDKTKLYTCISKYVTSKRENPGDGGKSGDGGDQRLPHEIADDLKDDVLAAAAALKLALKLYQQKKR
jgi:hypothetical protein